MIEVEGVWKQYKLGNVVDFNTSFREAITQRFSRNKAPAEPQEMFWALQDINLSIPAAPVLPPASSHLSN